MLPPPAPCNRRSLEQGWRYGKLVACIIATNVVRHNRKGFERGVSPRTRGRSLRGWKARLAGCEAFARLTTPLNREPGLEKRPPGRKPASSESHSSQHSGEGQVKDRKCS